eukprot:TRINITY_DN19825_c0_g3_i1.p1 TRINITY_DN19825_c0_g3~~TRINITY_DN19825_c0_g3_i1.p1  ORF type:complete len:287 (-),score=55.97 TRINITY_DN19825_c0_g3_i1:246-1106(-)
MLTDYHIRVLLRFHSTFLVASCKMFCGGFFWQALANEYPGSKSSLGFALTTGVGESIGVLIGQALLTTILAYWRFEGWMVVARDAAILAVGAFISGSAWEPMVQATRSLDFTWAALTTGVVCGTGFFLGITGMQWVLPPQSPTPSLKGPISSEESKYSAGEDCEIQVTETRSIDWSSNLTLSVAVMGAAAFFVATDIAFHGNWLQTVLGERDGSSKIRDCALSGSSTMMGFWFVQIFFVLVVPPGYLWTDKDLGIEKRHAPGDVIQSSDLLVKEFGYVYESVHVTS